MTDTDRALSVLADASYCNLSDTMTIEDDEAETLEDAGFTVSTAYYDWNSRRQVDGCEAADFIRAHDPEHIAEYFQ